MQESSGSVGNGLTEKAIVEAVLTDFQPRLAFLAVVELFGPDSQT